MKKIILLLLILTTTFGITNVKAMSYDYTLGQEIQVYNGHKVFNFSIANANLSNGYVNQWISFDKDNGNFNNSMGAYAYSFNGANFIRFSYSGAYYSYTASSTAVNLSETCSQQTDGVSQYTVTYADGSHATINRSQWQTYCYNHNISGTIGNNNFSITNIQPRISLISTSNWEQCEIDNGFILCPVHDNKIYGGLYIEYKTYQVGDAVITYNIKLYQSTYKVNTNTQAIIDNQNQNTQDTINTIKDSNINSSVITDTNGISNSADSQSQNVVLNFLMIPFNFMTNIVNSFENQCQQVCLGDCGSGHDNAFYFVLPCINLQNLLGNTLYGIIDALMCVTMIFAFIRSVIKFIQKCLLLEVDVSSEVKMF